MPLYEIIKAIHVLCAVLSITGFVVRGSWMMMDSSMLQSYWVKKLPHLNDSVLLLAAIALTFLTGQYPIQEDWLTTKVIALVVYILLGMVALHYGKTKTIKITALILAIVSFAYIVLVAMTQEVVPII